MSRIGLHFQRPVNDWPRTIDKWPAGTWFKAVDNVQLLDEAKRRNSGIKTVLRHWYDPGQIFGTTDIGVLRQRARDFFATFIDGTFEQFAHNVDAVEEWNEYNATSHTGQELAERVAWADAVSWVWKYEYRTVPKLAHIRLVLGNVAIGNDLPWQYAKFAYERDCILGYHPYVPVRDKQIMGDEWQYYSGRWTVMDAAFVARGYRCQWLMTEFGPVGYNPPASLNALDGWRHGRVCAGDITNYLHVIEYWLNRTHAWNRANGSRVLGAVLFTTGGIQPWGDYETRQPEIDSIANFMGAWAAANPPGPPPPPPPPEKPLQGITFARLIPLTHQVSDPFNAPRTYANGLHEGIDLAIVGGPADSDAMVRCAYDGVVDRVRVSTGAYYNYVVVRHVAGPEAAVPGTVFYTWYCHLDRPPIVAAGQSVAPGQPLGEIGNTGGNWGEHLHFNVTLAQGGLQGYAVANVVDPTPFVDLTPPPLEPRRYSRTVHLLPQNISRNAAGLVLDAAYSNRQTVTWSADDAVINPDTAQAILTARNVIVWGTPPGGSRAAFEAWVQQHYPPLPSITYRDVNQ